MGMPRSVPVLGTGSMHRPDSASLQPTGRLRAGEQQVGADGCSGAWGPACPWITGLMLCQQVLEPLRDTHSVPCFGFAPTSSIAKVPGLRTAQLNPGSIARVPLHAAVPELCRGAGKQPCTLTCRGGIAAVLRLLAQPPVCRSCSHPRKPQAKSPHPHAGAFHAGSTGFAAFFPEQ